MRLTTRISIPPPATETTEDIFSSSLSAIFSDVQNSHGTPGDTVIYTSPTFGPLTLRIPSHPDVEEGRRLFAHYLWNAGVIAADLIERASCSSGDDNTATSTLAATAPTKHSPPSPSDDDEKATPFNVTGRSVLELGAGTGLPSLICALSGARSVLITDHPCSPSITGDAIAANVRRNLFVSIAEGDASSVEEKRGGGGGGGKRTASTTTTMTTAKRTTPKTTTLVEVHGYAWGEAAFQSATKYGEPAAAITSSTTSPQHQTFERVLICDCLWLASEHGNLLSSARRWLPPSDSHSRSDGYIIVIAGFHTGRRIVAQFFELAVASPAAPASSAATDTTTPSASNSREEFKEDSNDNDGLEIVEIYEVDVDGVRREWATERAGETKEMTKRWCVVGVLRRKRRRRRNEKENGDGDGENEQGNNNDMPG